MVIIPIEFCNVRIRIINNQFTLVHNHKLFEAFFPNNTIPSYVIIDDNKKTVSKSKDVDKFAL